MARQKTFNENEVLKDATNLFWTKGFHQTSIQDLVETLGINRASLYDTYQDKYGLFTHCLTKYRDEVLNRAENTLSEEKTKKGFQNLFQFITESVSTDTNKKGCFICNTYAELLPSENTKITYFLSETEQLWTKMLSTTLKRGLKNNEIKNNTNIEEAANSMYASIIGVSTLSKITKNPKKLKNGLKLHLEIFN